MCPNLQINDCIKKASAYLLEHQLENSYWEGYLSSSAVATAVCTCAFVSVNKKKFCTQIKSAVNWLIENQNKDGGWGDDDKSPSNLPATLLATAALKQAYFEGNKAAISKSLKYIKNQGDLKCLDKYYGEDLTFSAPIKSICASANIISWKDVPALPFELVLVPKRLMHLVGMPVVSYALPVLCAVGIVKYKKYPPSNIFVRALRKIALKKALKLLIQVQPDTGGYLEAAPLTAFVIHSLALSGFKDSVIVKKGLHFILKGQRSDGSWPVDSNLSVWVTCLAVQALLHTSLYNKKRFEKTARWLMNQQIKVYTPYTSAEAGGWSWTHLHGGVPDGDDTANALLTLKSLGIKNSEDTIKNGVNWLIKLQNRDGGWPTFCKGFGKLLFDRSCADVTAHAILALRKCNISMNHPCIEKGIKWLIANQQSDGSWEPLWFGNQYSRSKKNFTYATFKALKALVMCGKKNSEATKKGVEWLVANQNSDGGWGSEKGVASSAEETAFALIALMAFDDKYSSVHSSVQKGIKWLVEHQRFDGSWNAAPIGLYFAKLWYYEKLYPVVFPLIALGNYSKLRAQ